MLSSIKQFCQNLQFTLDVTGNFISIYKISGMPPKVIFNVTIDTSFTVVGCNHSKLTSVRYLLSFAAKLESYFQLNDIFNYMRKQLTDLSL